MKKVTFISDTHGAHSNLDLPGGDFLFHSGDVTMGGSYNEALDFLKWFRKQTQYKHRVFTPGNHDFAFDTDWRPYTLSGEHRHRCRAPLYDETVVKEMIPDNVHYLNDSGVELDGIKIWGSPITPWFHDWAFNRRSEINDHWEKIPVDAQIILTHGPPYGMRDVAQNNGQHVGCPDLQRKLNYVVQPQIHSFGHIHEEYGVTEAEDNSTHYINASIMTLQYRPTNPPVVFEWDEHTNEIVW